MKYITILGDGMADFFIEEIQGTPLSKAYKPTMDSIAKLGEVGLCKTIPDGMSPGSDTANLSVLGYDPKIYYTGRSPLEAVSMGVKIDEKSITFRCNLVTLSNESNFEDKTMLDYSSDEISTEESRELIKALKKHFDDSEKTFYSGISYRHCLVFNEFSRKPTLIPPHDISGKKIQNHLPNDDQLLNIMKQAHDILNNHPVNLERISKGKNPANSIWLWGMGSKPALKNFEELYHVKGGIISAVDLLKGIGILANLKIYEVEGATGNIHTNFEGKAKCAIEALTNDCDFIYLHIEAPDECGHRRELENKVKSIELIDEKIVKPIYEYLKNQGDFRLVIMPDHPTPISLATHVSDPVPYIFYDSTKPTNCGLSYDEKSAQESKIFLTQGTDINRKLFGKQ